MNQNTLTSRRPPSMGELRKYERAPSTMNKLTQQPSATGRQNVKVVKGNSKSQVPVSVPVPVENDSTTKNPWAVVTNAAQNPRRSYLKGEQKTELASASVTEEASSLQTELASASVTEEASTLATELASSLQTEEALTDVKDSDVVLSAGEASKVSSAFDRLKQIEKTISVDNQTKNDFKDDLESAKQTEATASKSNKKKKRKTANLNKARQQKQQALTQVTESAIEKTEASLEVSPKNIYDFQQLSSMAYNFLMDRENLKIINLYESNVDLHKIESKDIRYNEATFELTLIYIQAKLNLYNEFSDNGEFYIKALNTIIDKLDKYLHSNTDIDSLLKESRAPGVLSDMDHINIQSHIFMNIIANCIVGALYLYNSFSNRAKEEKINLIKEKIGKLEKIVDSCSDKSLDSGFNLIRNYITGGIKTLSISTNVIIDSLSKTRRSNLKFNINILFSAFLQDGIKFSPEQRIQISSFMLLFFSRHRPKFHSKNFTEIQLVFDIVETTIKEDCNLDDYFLILQNLIQSIHKIDGLDTRTMSYESKKKFFHLIKNIYNLQKEKLTKIITNPKYSDQKIFNCVELLTNFNQFLSIFDVRNKCMFEYLGDEIINKINTDNKEILKGLRDIVLSIPVDSVDEQKLKFYKGLIAELYVRIIYEENGLHKEITKSPTVERQRIDFLISDLLDKTSILPRTRNSIRMLSKLYSFCYRIIDSSERYRLNGNTKQKLVDFYKATIADDENHPLLLLEISRWLATTENKILAKEALFKFLNNPNAFDDIVGNEQLYNVYNYLSIVLYDLGDVISAAKYNEAACKLHEKHKSPYIIARSYEDLLAVSMKIACSLYKKEKIAIFEHRFNYIIKSLEEYFLVLYKRDQRYHKLKKVVPLLFNLLVKANLYSQWDEAYAKIMGSFDPKKRYHLEYESDRLYRHRSEFLYTIEQIRKGKLTEDKLPPVLDRFKKCINELEQVDEKIYKDFNELYHSCKTLGVYYRGKDRQLSDYYLRKADRHFRKASILRPKQRKAIHDFQHDYESRA